MANIIRQFAWVIILLMFFLGAFVIGWFVIPGSRAVTEKSNLYVPTGATYQTLLDSLSADDKINNSSMFDKLARAAGIDKNIRPGRYILEKGMSYRQVVQMLRRGLQTPVRLTFNNARTADRLAGAISRHIEADSVAMLALFSDTAFTRQYGFEPHTFIAMFIPNTYEVYWNIAPKALCDRMKREYGAFWTQERSDKADALSINRLQVSTLASIVYEETKMRDEMPRVAGVYINRLRIGMPLQADPTVKFAVGDPTLRRVLNKHLEVDSPYNTYRHQGLPPGPICMPSIRALDAVLNYEHHKYLYFCAAADFSGYHKFSETLAGHTQNAREYSAALNRQGIMK